MMKLRALCSIITHKGRRERWAASKTRLATHESPTRNRLIFTFESRKKTRFTWHWSKKSLIMNSPCQEPASHILFDASLPSEIHDNTDSIGTTAKRRIHAIVEYLVRWANQGTILKNVFWLQKYLSQKNAEYERCFGIKMDASHCNSNRCPLLIEECNGVS